MKKSNLLLLDISAGILIGLGVAIIIGAIVLASDKPVVITETKDYARSSVKILNSQETSGGSGSILSSSESGSLVLTNNHVCDILKDGGKVKARGRDYLPISFIRYDLHDLCLIKLNENLGVSVKLASTAPSYYTEALISGHPGLLPHVLSKGDFSDIESIEVLTDIRECTKEELSRLGWICLYYGIPVIERYQAQLITGTILPGSSGSAVFNNKGEVSGVVFASRSRELSYAFAVPQAYVRHFVQNYKKYPSEKISYKVSISYEQSTNKKLKNKKIAYRALWFSK